MSAFDQLELFSRVTRLGTFSLEPVDADRDDAVLHGWVTHPKSVYWDMQATSVNEVRAEYAGIVADPHHDAWLGRVDGIPESSARPTIPRTASWPTTTTCCPATSGCTYLSRRQTVRGPDSPPKSCAP